MVAKNTRPTIVDIYELSPMQEAMLFNSAYAPDSMAYFDQFSCVIEGELQTEAFREAWQMMTDRHAVFRTSFHWQDLPKPVQVVEEQINLPWFFADWRGLASDLQAHRWQTLIEEDRRKGFQLDKSPLLRCHLVRVKEDRYFFAWSHHHIILDGWCLSLVLEELIDIYRALKNGRSSNLKPVRSYRDYIIWLQQQDKAKAEQYWKNELQGFAAPTELLSDATVRSKRSVVADRNEEVRLDSELSRKLRQFASSIQVTPNILAQGAWAILLHRYSGERDVLFGATVSGRPVELRGIEEMIGVFINTIPIRVQVEPELLLTDWLRKLQSQQAARLQYAFVSPGDIQQWSNVSGGTALFNSNLIFMNYPLSQEVVRGAGEFAIRDVVIFEQTDLPLTLQVTPGELWSIETIYDSGRFGRDSIRRMLGHFIHLLEEFVAEPDRQLSAFPILTENERRQLFDDFNNSQVEFDAEKTIVHRLEEIAKLHPEYIVVECAGRTVSAQSLNSSANQMARYLMTEIDLRSEDVVAILMRRSERMIRSILAIWKCGAAYVPIDPDYPEERIKTIVESSGAKLVLTEQECSGLHLGSDLEQRTHLLVLDTISTKCDKQDDSNPEITIKPDTLAYVIFTSGSTGKPKGAMVEHVGMLNHLLAKVSDLKIDSTSIVAQTASHCFDISIWQMFAAPMNGGKTIVYSDEDILEPDRFIDRIESDGVTIVELVPSYLSALLDCAENREGVFSTLRYFQVTGEAVTPALIKRWFSKFPDIPVANAYGPTECSDNVTHYTMHEVPQTASISIGKPLRNFNIYIVDEYMNLCPVGVKGEICASGIGVGRGYLNDTARTAAVFLEDPFREERGVRFYKTGDIGCYMPDGNLLLFGRKDHQIKIRGFRIELGEIEVALSRLAGIREAVVLDRRDDGKEPYLCAYYAVRDGIETSRETLARALSAELPDYMIPSVFVEMDELPLTANGKIDRARLPVPNLTQLSDTSNWIAPGTEAERILAGVWSDVLGVKAPGIHDNFFSLGGDSILSMQIVSRAKQAGLKLAVIDIFRAPTISELALRAIKIDMELSEGRNKPLPSGVFPLTPAQRHFLETTRIDAHHYNQSLLIETPEGVNADWLEKAIRFASSHHDSLRLRFIFADDEWHQELSESVIEISFILEDLSAIPEVDHQTTIRFIAERLQASLDISAGPLMIAALFKRGEGRPASLLLIVHHLCIDGISWSILIEDIVAAYDQLEQGGELRLPEPVTDFVEWSVRLADYARNEIGASEKQYWLDVAHSETAPLPVDFRADANDNTVASIDVLSVRLETQLTNALLKDVPRAYNTRINDVLLTALALAFRDWTGDGKLRLDLESHGREIEVDTFNSIDLSRTTGWFTANFPVVLSLEENVSDITSHLKSVKEQLRGIPNHGLGYGLLRYYGDDAELRKELNAMVTPSVLFNYLGQTDRSAKIGSGWKAHVESTGRDRSPDQIREHLIEINGLTVDNRIEFSFSYSRNFHKKEIINNLAQGFKTYLTAIIERCAQPDAGGFTPSDFPLAHLTLESLDLLLAELKTSSTGQSKKEIADIYALSPVQQGMLFHSLYTPDSDTYFNQLTCMIEGPLKTEIFSEAWAKVIAHHPVLRTSFHWQNLRNSVQVVHRNAQAEWLYEDWSLLSVDEREAGWQKHLRDDRRRKFDLAQPPLMRLNLFRISDQIYYFNWSHHHLLVDGWSSAIVLNDVLMAYTSILNTTPLTLDIRQPFRENIEWITRADTIRAENYWREKLHGITSPTALVLGRPAMEDSIRAGSYAEAEQRLSTEVTKHLHELARECGITLNTIAQGAWSLLLSRYSGDSEVVYGSVVSGRNPEIEGSDKMVGVFINSLPARIRVEPEQSVISWLEELQVEQIEREQYAYSSLTEIQRWSGIPSGTTLFESLLIFENYPTEEFLQHGADSLSITQVRAIEPNNYPVTLVVTPGREINLKIMYDNGRFDQATIQRLLGHYEVILRQISASPHQAVRAIDILTCAEREQILHDWNYTDAPMPADRTFIQLFEDQVSLTPDLTAIQFNGESYSYRELNERSNQLARYLLSIEAVRSDDRIAVLMSRSAKMVESILAIWKCGAAYVPVDLNYPRERIKTVLADSGAKLVITCSDTTGFDEEAGDCQFKLIDLDRIAPQRLQQSTANLDRSPNLYDLAYVIFTSGSTGKPKGVMIEQRGMLNHLLAMSRRLEIGQDSVVAQTASHCFDISMWQFFAALMSGGRTVIYDDETIFDPDALIDRFNAHGVQLVQFVPSYLTVFLDALENRRDPSLLRNLKRLVTIGEILKPDYVRRWFNLYPHIKLVNAYGPTEASDSVTHFEMQHRPPMGTIPIGHPIQNMRVYVLDWQMNLCPIGVKGEICIGGIGVGRGYLGDDERTRAAFFPDPFSDDPHARIYKTGDIGCYSPDGSLLFFGRKDYQVKIRGHRIELGEIENALVRIDGVRNAAVVDREIRNQKTLCAYVALRENVRKKPSELIGELASRLPAYMLPDVVSILPELPLTTGGKIDRNRLPAVETHDSDVADYSEPSTETEIELTRIWKDVLETDKIGIDNHFTDMGGHSLNAIQIVSQIRKYLRRDIAFADIFEFDTIRLLAARLDMLSENTDAQIPRLAESEYYEMSHAQKRIWLASRSRESSIAYNMEVAAWLEGHLDRSALKTAFRLLVERHESLRTVFVTTKGKSRQKVYSTEEATIGIVDVDYRGDDSGETKAVETMREMSETAFDLVSGPLFKVMLIQVTDSKYLLVIIMHHIIGDAWSLQIIFDELLTLYAACLEGRSAPIEPLNLQYRDYAAWHNQWLNSTAAQVDRSYWLEKLSANMPYTSIPYDLQAYSPRSFAGDSVTMVVADHLVEGIRQLAERHKTSVYSIVLAAIYTLIFRYTNQEDIVIGTQTAGRGRGELEAQIGCFVNSLVLRASVSGTDTIYKIVRTVSETLSEAIKHQEYPFDKLLEDLRVPHSSNQSPLFEIQADYVPDLHRSLRQVQGADLKITALSEHQHTTKFAVSFLIGESSGGSDLVIEIAYNVNLFRRDSIMSLSSRLRRVLHAFVEDETRAINTIALNEKISAQPRVQIDFNI